jgi:hypothetical protein
MICGDCSILNSFSGSLVPAIFGAGGNHAVGLAVCFGGYIRSLLSRELLRYAEEAGVAKLLLAGLLPKRSLIDPGF